MALDEKQLSLVLNFGSALVGALAGGWATYMATGWSERTRRSEVGGRLQGVLLSEILGHQATLILDIDRMLPLWLRRGQPGFWDGSNPLQPLPFGHLSLQQFDLFRDHLLDSDSASSLSRYFEHARQLNEWAQSNDYSTQVRDRVAVLEENLALTRHLLTTTPRRRLDTPQLTEAINTFHLSEERYRRILAVTKYSPTDLFSLASKVEQSGIASAPPPLNTSDDWLNYVEAAARLRPDGPALRR